MQIGSLGDLAQSYSMQSRNTALKTDIQRLTQELASGKISDVRDAMGGNTAYANDIERHLKKLDGFDLATREASQLAAGMQGALSRINDVSTSFRNTLLTSSNSALGETHSTVISQARGSLEDVISALNTNVGGRSIFAGMATDTSPIATPQTLITNLTTAMAGAGNVDDMLTAATAWFDNPAGFGATSYLGSSTSLAPIPISDGDTAQLDVRGDSPEIRAVLKNLALVSVANDPALGLTAAQKNELLVKVTPDALGANEGIIDLQTTIGFSEGRIESNLVRQSTERSTLEIARNELLAINPYETATELEQVQFQLQSLYAITSRMSQLSLVNFL